MESKVENRKKILQMLKKFSDYEKGRQNKEVLEQLTASSDWKSAKKIALYMSMPIEFNLTELFDQSDDKEILIPRCLPQRQMIFAKYDKENLVRSKFGLLEPKSDLAIEPDFILVPGLIWNDEGHRIGFGGGYYDRYLANFEGMTASVLYDFQKMDFAAEAHDIAVKKLFIGRKNNEF